MHDSTLTYSSADVCLSRARYRDGQDGAVSRTLLLDVVDDILGVSAAGNKRIRGQYQ